MQGGAADAPVRLRSAVDAVKCCEKPGKKKPEGDKVTPPLDTLHLESETVISPAVDAALENARSWFAWSLATPIAWLHLDTSVTACRNRKHQRVRDGAAFNLALQQKCRTAFGDVYFTFWSFFAEEEFYLLSLPILFWNIDYRFARHMTLVVCFGLLWGNLLKDVFRLPRPKNVEPLVWVPKSATHIDSTATRDFGFPSTHAMNSISNSLFTVLYCMQHGLAGKPVSGSWLCGGSAFWIFSIAFGRLYLGVHSPMDVKGGILLGLALVFICQRPVRLCDHFDRWMLTMPHVGVVLMTILIVLLILNPQPRPMTPTFMQNCVLCGLIFGCSSGFRMETDRRRGRGIFGLSSPSPQDMAHVGSNDLAMPVLVLRTVVGFALILLARVVLKAVLVCFFHQVGLEPSPAKPVPRKDVARQEKKQELKGWDLWAAAVVKTTVYAALSWTITCGCPAFFEAVLGLPCEMNG